MPKTTTLRLRCPDCKDHASIDITATVDVRLRQYDRSGEDFGTDADMSRCGDHEWDETSPASCGCGWRGKVGLLMRGRSRNHDQVEMGECAVCGHSGKDCIGEK